MFFAMAVLVAVTAVVGTAQQESIEELRVRAEQGDAEAEFDLGTFYDMGYNVPQDATEAARWYRLAAEQGHAFAQFNLGTFYDMGYGVPEDAAEAARWYRLAADQGIAVAQFNLANMYATGRGVPMDVVTTYMWAIIASRIDNALMVSETMTISGYRDAVAAALTSKERDEGQRLAGEWETAHPDDSLIREPDIEFNTTAPQ